MTQNLLEIKIYKKDAKYGLGNKAAIHCFLQEKNERSENTRNLEV